MKKLFSILFAIIIILSGMNLSVDSHICCGKIAAVKISITHEKAFCGMESCEKEIITQNSFEPLSCCKDQEILLQVDNIYNVTSFRLKEPVQKLFQTFYIPEVIGKNNSFTFTTTKSNVLPPDQFLTCAVSLPDICAFLI